MVYIIYNVLKFEAPVFIYFCYSLIFFRIWHLGMGKTLFFANIEAVSCTIQPKYILCIWTPIFHVLYLQTISSISETGVYYTRSVIWNIFCLLNYFQYLTNNERFWMPPMITQVANRVCWASQINSCACAVDYICMSTCESRRNLWRLGVLLERLIFPAL
jgi:hypothetical protein